MEDTVIDIRVDYPDLTQSQFLKAMALAWKLSLDQDTGEDEDDIEEEDQ